MLRRAVMITGVALLSTGTARAGPRRVPPVDLAYTRGRGAEACPGVEALRRAVLQEMGYDPFTGHTHPPETPKPASLPPQAFMAPETPDPPPVRRHSEGPALGAAARPPARRLRVSIERREDELVVEMELRDEAGDLLWTV